MSGEAPITWQGVRAAFRRSLKQRPAPEALNALLFRPLGFLVAWLFARTPVRPIHLVLTHTLVGLVAAWTIARGRDRCAAVLLQVVTVLDNADGQLARLRDEITELGRYADTELDTAVNAALFSVIAARTGQVRRSALAFFVLTLLLSWDFNIESLYRKVRGEPFRPEVRDPDSRWLYLARSIYRIVFAPQDRAIQWLETRLFEWTSRGLVPEERDRAARRWWGRWVAGVAANLGLTTQYAWLGVFLWRGRLHQYPAFVVSQVLAPGLTLFVRCRRMVWRRRERMSLSAED